MLPTLHVVQSSFSLQTYTTPQNEPLSETQTTRRGWRGWWSRYVESSSLLLTTCRLVLGSRFSGGSGFGGSQNGTGSAAFRLPLLPHPASCSWLFSSQQLSLGATADIHHADSRNYRSLVVLSSGCALVHGPSTGIGQDTQVTSTFLFFAVSCNNNSSSIFSTCSPHQDSHRDSRGAWHAHHGRKYLCSCPFITGSQPKHQELLYGTATTFAGLSLRQAPPPSRGLNMKIVHAVPAGAGAAAAHA